MIDSRFFAYKKTLEENDIQIRYAELPPTFHGLVVREDVSAYSIYINPALNHESQIDTAIHELEHIKKKDFDKMIDINTLELLMHK